MPYSARFSSTVEKVNGIAKEKGEGGVQWRVRKPTKTGSDSRWPRRIDAAIRRNRLDYSNILTEIHLWFLNGMRVERKKSVAVVFPLDVTLKLEDVSDTSILDDSDATLQRLLNNDVKVIEEAEARARAGVAPKPDRFACLLAAANAVA